MMGKGQGIHHFQESKNCLKKLRRFLLFSARSVPQCTIAYIRDWKVKFSFPVFIAEVGKGEGG